MSDFLYPSFKQALLNKEIDLDTDTIKAVLVTSAHTASTAHDFLDDVSAGHRVATATLSGVTITGGVVDASDLTFTAVSGSAASQIIIYHDSGSEATSHLIAHIDSYTGLPVTPSGGDINVAWPNDSAKIFAL